MARASWRRRFCTEMVGLAAVVGGVALADHAGVGNPGGIRLASSQTQSTAAANTADGGCAASTLRAAAVPAYEPAYRAFVVSGVEVRGLDPSCEGRTVSVVVSAADGTELGRADGHAAGPSMQFVLSGTHPRADEVARVAVAVS